MKLNTQIAQYYNDTQILYDLFWSKHGLHEGMWYPDTKKTSEAVENTNKYIVKTVGASNRDVVLDAGCGTGSIALHIAKETGATVIGVALSDVQLKKARTDAVRSGLNNQVCFYNRDFINSGFGDGYFSKVYSVEAACHAINKHDLVKEMFRLLNKHGKLTVLDAFLSKSPIRSEDVNSYNNFLHGFAVPSLSNVDAFRHHLEDVGFTNVKYVSNIEECYKSFRVLRHRGLIAYPVVKALSMMHVIPKTILAHTFACISTIKLVDAGIMDYGTFTAEKAGSIREETLKCE